MDDRFSVVVRIMVENRDKIALVRGDSNWKFPGIGLEPNSGFMKQIEEGVIDLYGFRAEPVKPVKVRIDDDKKGMLEILYLFRTEKEELDPMKDLDAKWFEKDSINLPDEI